MAAAEVAALVLAKSCIHCTSRRRGALYQRSATAVAVALGESFSEGIGVIPLSARLENDPVELERLDCSMGTSRRKQLNVSIYFNVALAAIYLVFTLVHLARPVHDSVMGCLWLSLCIGYLTLAGLALNRKRRFVLAQTTTDSNVTISDAGLVFMPSDRELGWRKLESIVDARGYLVFVDASRIRHAAIAKSELPNEGRDLWRELYDLLASKRYLVRSTLSHARIVIDKPRRDRVTTA